MGPLCITPSGDGAKPLIYGYRHERIGSAGRGSVRSDSEGPSPATAGWWPCRQRRPGVLTPSEGVYGTERVPFFLRAVVIGDGQKDVLDQPEDNPLDGETVHVYERRGAPGVVLSCGQGISRTIVSAEYWHRPDVTVEFRDTSLWRNWASGRADCWPDCRQGAETVPFTAYAVSWRAGLAAGFAPARDNPETKHQGDNMNINPLEFPDHRRRDPKRRAEARVYDELAGSDASGHVLYEVKPRADAPECDFAIWLEGIGTFGMQVKGGENRLERGEWFLVTDQGRQKVKSLTAEVWDAAMAIHDTIHDKLGRKSFVVPVACFPDMEYDRYLKERCAAKRIGVIFGVEDLVPQLQDLAEAAEVFQTPSARTITEEVELIRDGAMPETPAGTRPIQVHVDLVEVHIHVSGVEKEGGEGI